MDLHKKGENCVIMPLIHYTTNLVQDAHQDLVSDSLNNYLMISCDILSTELRIRKT